LAQPVVVHAGRLQILKYPNSAVQCRGNLRRSGRRGCQLSALQTAGYKLFSPLLLPL